MSDLENTEKDCKTEPESSIRKRIRHRKKLLYEKILKQMEFYFGDANLSKDRFLSQLVKEDPYVPIETFLKFNKIRAMTNDPTDIAKAMKHSSLLELSEDKTKVRRCVPLENYCAESRTIYVEGLPSTATRTWLHAVFSRYGTVAYSSLPRYKESQRIKGYTFVEFNTDEEAQKCITAFSKMGRVLPSGLQPDQLASVLTFQPPECNSTEVDDYLDKDDKLNEETYKPTTDESLSKEDENKDDIENQTEAVEEPPRKRKRRGDKLAAAKKRAEEAPLDNDALNLKVLPKRTWRILRNQYLNLLRRRHRDLRRQPDIPDDKTRQKTTQRRVHVRFDDEPTTAHEAAAAPPV